MEDEIKAEIKKEFIHNHFSIEDEYDVLKQCASFCMAHNLKPSELVSNWELYYLNMQLEGNKVQGCHMKGFLCHLKTKLKRDALRIQQNAILNPEAMHEEEEDEEIEQSSPSVTKPAPVVAKKMEIGEMIACLALKKHVKVGGPSNKRRSKSKSRAAAIASACTPFTNRVIKYQVHLNFNPLVEASVENEGPTSKSQDDFVKEGQDIRRLSLDILGKPLNPGFLYMNFTIEKRFLAMETRIKDFTVALAACESRSSFHHVALASQESVFVVGIVLCDGDGRLNDKSVLLQGSAEYSGGHRVKLDLHKLVEFSLFPGQVVGIEGYNITGHCLVATRLIDSYPVPKSFSAAKQDKRASKKIAIYDNQQKESLEKAPKRIKMLIAAGPFSTCENLDFQPLEEILQYSREKGINLLMLMGPFVDREHATVKDGTVDRHFEDIFLEEICYRLQSYCEGIGPNIQIILVPSTRDVHHDYVFPQAALDSSLFYEYRQQITCLANPCLLRVNDITVGICTVDVLKHLSSAETSRNSEQGSIDRLTRLATHLLKQRSFYPLYPAGSRLPLDLSVAQEALSISVALDMLILPSDLTPFVKVLEVGSHMEQQHKCVCINPGRLAKGTLGGFFAEVFTLEKDTYAPFIERTTISIIRL